MSYIRTTNVEDVQWRPGHMRKFKIDNLFVIKYLSWDLSSDMARKPIIILYKNNIKYFYNSKLAVAELERDHMRLYISLKTSITDSFQATAIFGFQYLILLFVHRTRQMNISGL